jgi:hypothetical protein
VKSKDIVAREPESRKLVEDAEGEHLRNLPPMMTSSSFDFRVYLKNIFALEPPLKLATFVVEEVIYQNVNKKVKKLSPATVIAAAVKVA